MAHCVPNSECWGVGLCSCALYALGPLEELDLFLKTDTSKDSEIPCPTGTHSSNGKQPGCKPCPKGSYTDVTLKACLECTPSCHTLPHLPTLKGCGHFCHFYNPSGFLTVFPLYYGSFGYQVCSSIQIS